MTHYTNTNNPIDFPKKKKIPMLERFAAQSLVEHDGELIFSKEKFAELIVRECINREELLGAIARGWCSEKNSHKTMDSDLAVAIFDQVEQHIRQQFGVEE
jgi:hypothetical protein